MSERKRNRLLIVDDEPDITTTFKLLLEDCGFEVDAYNDPQIALSDFRPGFYDLLLLDIRMPIINGFDLYDKMKVIDNKVNVCFMSAYDVNYELLRQQFPWLEVQCFIPKPVEISEIVRRVNREIVLTTV
jgi:two-component system response regulator ChvI